MMGTVSSVFVQFLALLAASRSGSWNTQALQIGRCQTALGMQTGDILDAALSASSSMDPLNTGPQSARIRSEIRGGAWCPKRQISKDVYEYLEVDLGQLHVITLVETQGRFGNGQGQDYTEQYGLEYQREADGKWFHFRNRRGQEIIQGNTNTHIAEMREVQPPIVAKKIRFVPHSTHPKAVCLRVELYGCLWHDGIIAYDVPQGEERGHDLHFMDTTYDGVVKDGFMSGGLGQLFDGEEGQSNFRLDPLGLGAKGYEWVGWRNESFPNGFFEIIFKFDQVRNFTSVSLHCNNMHTRDVRVFSMARIYFSGVKPGRHDFDSVPLEFVYVRDDLMEYARTVTIPLEHGIGQFIKIQLFFEARWILISEVHFISEIHETGYIVDANQTLSLEKSGGKLQQATSYVTTGDLLHPGSGTANRTDLQFKMSNATSGESTSETSFLSNILYVPSNSTLPDSSASWNISRFQNKNKSGLDDESIVIMITVLVVVMLTLCAVIVVVAFKRSKYNCVHNRFPVASKSNKPSPSSVGDSSDSSYGPQLITFSHMSGLLQPNSHMSHSYLTPSCHHDQSDEPDHSDTTVPLISTPLPQPPCASPYATVDILNLFHNRDQPSTGRFSTVPRNTDRCSPPWMDFPRESLKFMQSLGQGLSGEVYLCELLPRGNSQPYGMHGSMRTSASKSSFGTTLVAVKVVGKNASDQAREDFQREAFAMSRLNDPNIVRLLGVCINSDPFYIVLEYPPHGDLKNFLQNSVLEGTGKQGYRDMLSYGCLIYMASQIASGMKFLESSNLVHRDLATRNCLVGDDYLIKISDFGNGHTRYPDDYFATPGNVPLPVRWMAWEALRLSNFTTKSDIWSFGVTMWEMLTFAQQPYETLTNEEVIVNANHLLQNPSLWMALEQPDPCPREVYDLLCHCWSRDKSQRPTFHEVHMFLQRKNAGYHPGRDRCLGRTKASVSLFV